jgi:hypothetical protein
MIELPKNLTTNTNIHNPTQTNTNQHKPTQTYTMNSVVEFILPFLQSCESLNMSVTSHKLSSYINEFRYLVQKPLITQTEMGIQMNTGSDCVVMKQLVSMKICLQHKQPQIKITGLVPTWQYHRYREPTPSFHKSEFTIPYEKRWLYFYEFKQIRLREIAKWVSTQNTKFKKISENKIYNCWELIKIEEQRLLTEIDITRRLLMAYDSYKCVRVYNEYNWPKRVWSKK